jgi:hypothetical protein
LPLTEFMHQRAIDALTLMKALTCK